MNQFVLINVLCILLFWFVRIPIMKVGHFQRMRADSQWTGPDDRWMSSLYHSIMTQTTVGASDIVPVSWSARVVTGLQALTALLSAFFLALFFAYTIAHQS